MDGQDERDGRPTPFGRGFVAAGIVLAAVLLCGGALLLNGRDAPSGPPAGGSAAPGGVSADASPDPGPEFEPAVPDSSPGGDSGNDQPAGTTGAGCGPGGADQAVPVRAPRVDGWEVSRRVVVPRSAAVGPATVDADGLRRCFAHSPTGAVYAAYNAIAALADQQRAAATVGRLMVPGAETDALLRTLRTQQPVEGSEPVQPAGFRVLDATRDRVTVTLAMPVDTQYMSATLTLAWFGGDWRVVAPPPGRPVGSPYAQHRDLGGFIAFGGL